MQGFDVLVPLFGVVFAFGTPIILVALILRYRMKRAHLLHQTILTMVEKGVPVPAELLNPPWRPKSDLRNGIALIAVGLGLGIFFAVTTGDSGAWGIGMIPLLLGIGFIIAWKIEVRNKEEPH
jgi:Domain of unknown function (DUF6249)